MVMQPLLVSCPVNSCTKTYLLLILAAAPTLYWCQILFTFNYLLMFIFGKSIGPLLGVHLTHISHLADCQSSGQVEILFLYYADDLSDVALFWGFYITRGLNINTDDKTHRCHSDNMSLCCQLFSSGPSVSETLLQISDEVY